MNPSDLFPDDDIIDRTVIRPSPGRRGPPSLRSVPPPQTSSDTSLPQGYSTPIEAQDDNPLLAASFGLLSFVPKLRTLPFHDAVNQLQDQLIAEIKIFEKRALDLGASKSQVDVAKILLCPLLDETVLNTPWGSQSGWGHHSLSSMFIGKIDLGQEFFQIVARLKRDPSRNQAVLEMAYLCLSLGFEGKYRYRENGQRRLEEHREELYLLIRKVKGDLKPELSIHWQGMSESKNPLVRYIPLWVLATLFGVLLLGSYMAFDTAVGDAAAPLYRQLVAMARNIAAAPPGLVQPVVLKRPSPSAGHQFEQLLAGEIARKEVTFVDGAILRIFDMFPSGQAEISPKYDPLMVKIAYALQQTGAVVNITGHTDNRKIKFSNRFSSNWHLSQARAESVAKTLARQGVPKERIRFEGMADTDPIATNTTRSGRALNRRIDIYLR